MTNIIYFSNVSENTHRFVGKVLASQAESDAVELAQILTADLGPEEIMRRRIDFDLRTRLSATRLPLVGETILADEPFVLITPTYGDGDAKKLVPKQVVKFLNVETNRNLIRGVIGSGNQNFGEAFAKAGRIVSAKCQVPFLYAFEILGSDEDVEKVRVGLGDFWATDGQLTDAPVSA